MESFGALEADPERVLREQCSSLFGRRTSRVLQHGCPCSPIKAKGIARMVCVELPALEAGKGTRACAHGFGFCEQRGRVALCSEDLPVDESTVVR